MGVTVTSQGSGGSASPQFSYFADSFDRIDQPFLMGNDWIGTPLAGYGTGFTSPQLEAMINVALNPGFLTITNGGAVYAPTYLYHPIRISPYTWGKSQFSEIIVDTMSNFLRQDLVGLIVLAVPNRGNFYTLDLNNNGAGGLDWILNRYVNGVSTALTGFTGSSYGKKLRLSVTVGTPHTLTVTEDGVQVGQITDAALNAAGMPGMNPWVKGGHMIRLRGFKCGSLPQMRTADDYSQ